MCVSSCEFLLAAFGLYPFVKTNRRGRKTTGTRRKTKKIHGDQSLLLACISFDERKT